MSGELIFITGATGFVGFAVLTKALQAGYKVRISVRKAEQIETLKSHVLIAPYVEKGVVDFAVVPDITVKGAFDSALKDVVGVLHIASPLPQATNDPEKDIILPAINGTTSLLNSALLHPTIHRIVLTSSVVALMSNQALMSGDPSTTYTPQTRRSPLPTAPWGADPGEAYFNSKALSLHATDTFLATQSPNFTIVNIMPGFVIGRSELITKSEDLLKSTNAVPLSIILGVKSDKKPAMITHIDDVARIHVAALDTAKVPGNRSFLLQSGDGGKIVFDDALEVARENFRGAVEEGILPLGGTTGNAYQIVESGETEEVFGGLRSYREAVESVVGQFVELKRRELGMA
ncbi:hypothetical protein ONS95_006222 [Cadophora gregata]|uniref:uncharacterized protein n=1 Tax=Cadophora gregata TaxID=51156 RepID=UPI0026DD292E|nr:uncharacterized protein ONS95_006222 [Cadophora gregata]KAK0102613.1 hypothetical protein ONS95_006222 [Cadophora gregata]